MMMTDVFEHFEACPSRAQDDQLLLGFIVGELAYVACEACGASYDGRQHGDGGCLLRVSPKVSWATCAVDSNNSKYVVICVTCAT